MLFDSEFQALTETQGSDNIIDLASNSGEDLISKIIWLRKIPARNQLDLQTRIEMP